MPTATIDTHPWTTNDLVPHKLANCFPLKVGHQQTRCTKTYTHV